MYIVFLAILLIFALIPTVDALKEKKKTKIKTLLSRKKCVAEVIGNQSGIFGVVC